MSCNPSTLGKKIETNEISIVFITVFLFNFKEIKFSQIKTTSKMLFPFQLVIYNFNKQLP